jgi:hypothetical protein
MMDAERLTRLQSALRDVGRIRIDLPSLQNIFLDCNPELRDHPDRFSILKEHLDKLAQERFLTLPATKRSTLSGSTPALPLWIKVVRTRAKSAIDPYAISWVKELAFCVSLKHAGQLRTAKIINDFMIQNRHLLSDMIPARERSVQIFGDEKRLDSITARGALFQGRLPLSALGAFEVPLPVPCEKAIALHKPVLVVENHHTYWSFCAWNRIQAEYSAVMFGGGNMVLNNDVGLSQLIAEMQATEFEYFADIDARGVLIAEELFDLMFRKHAIVGRPAMRFYRWLLRNGRRVRTRREQSAQTLNLDKIKTFPVDFVSEFEALLAAAERIAQESLNHTILKNDFS